MKTTKLILTATIILVIAACSATKKSTAPTAAAVPASKTPATSTAPLIFVKPSTRTRVPGNEELIAIQAKYKDVTLETLKEGHTLYTTGACVSCHGAVDINMIKEAEWKGIIDDMAQKANITDAQKDAVYKYVLAIKATQLK